MGTSVISRIPLGGGEQLDRRLALVEGDGKPGGAVDHVGEEVDDLEVAHRLPRRAEQLGCAAWPPWGMRHPVDRETLP